MPWQTPTISKELRLAGSHIVSYDPETIPYEKIVTWFKAPDKEDDVYESGSDDSGFDLDDLSGMKASAAVAECGYQYYMENRVVYLYIDNGHGRGIVEGTSPYELEFDYCGGEIRNLTCSCFCSYLCKHEVVAMLQLKKLLKWLKGNSGFDVDKGGYVAAINQSTFFSFAVDGKTSGSFVFKS